MIVKSNYNPKKGFNQKGVKMKKYSFTLANFGNPVHQALEVKIFALPDQTPLHQVHERIPHPYAHTPIQNTPTDSHYQHFVLTKPTQFLAKIIEGRTFKTAIVHIMPNASKIEVEGSLGHDSCTEGDIYDILSCFSFKLGNRYLGLKITPDRSHVSTGRDPFILIKQVETNPV